ncbi:uncharacterized protein J4E87_003208 [Alternaria ethzedia]|uniref:uncharacterized protein n=1 Tax=Alternaria ethzedia TaxID=181014 RepID=UPI0020C3042F|nr:uncharacterized protein J4E87_003208 [Alternaria ethzedia]KAI4630018.1 hypothetical protein J4E87_003208 [Alternaria ethzedia]
MPDVYKTGYTSSYSIVKGIERMLKLPGRPYSRFDKCDVKLVASKQDFKKYQDSDGRCERLFKKGVDGEIIDDGWITKGLFAVCKVAAELIRKRKEKKKARKLRLHQGHLVK